MKRLILHIGTEKTGSTSIQRMLELNADVLSAHGITTLRSLPRNAKFKMAWRDQGDEGWEILAKAAAEAREGDTLIVSHEGLYRLGAGMVFERLHRIFADFEITVVTYIREQADVLQSMVMQNQKKIERMFDFRSPSAFDGFEQRRNLDYFRICRQIEREFGREAVSMRLFDTDAFVGNDLLTDFLTTAGFDDLDSIVAPPRSNTSMAPGFAELLRVNWKDWAKRYRPGDLTDVALRLSANGHGGRYFLSEHQVRQIRMKYEESNRRTARRYLANADTIPERDVWDEGDVDLTELEALLIENVEWGTRLAGEWSKGERIGSRLLAEGWEYQIADTGLIGTPAAEECTVRLRSPYQGRHRRKPVGAILLGGVNPDEELAGVTINGKELGEMNVITEPITFDAASLEPLDRVELQLRFPKGSDSAVEIHTISVDI